MFEKDLAEKIQAIASLRKEAVDLESELQQERMVACAGKSQAKYNELLANYHKTLAAEEVITDSIPLIKTSQVKGLVRIQLQLLNDGQASDVSYDDIAQSIHVYAGKTLDQVKQSLIKDIIQLKNGIESKGQSLKSSLKESLAQDKDLQSHFLASHEGLQAGLKKAICTVDAKYGKGAQLRDQSFLVVELGLAAASAGASGLGILASSSAIKSLGVAVRARQLSEGVAQVLGASAGVVGLTASAALVDGACLQYQPSFHGTEPKNTCNEFAVQSLDAQNCAMNALLVGLGIGPEAVANQKLLSRLKKWAAARRDLAEAEREAAEVGKYAEEVLGRSLSKEEQSAVYEAHKIGKNEPGKDGRLAGLNNYTQEQSARKRARLRQSGFGDKEIEILMEKGVVGEPTARAEAITLFKAGNSEDISILAKYLVGRDDLDKEIARVGRRTNVSQKKIWEAVYDERAKNEINLISKTDPRRAEKIVLAMIRTLPDNSSAGLRRGALKLLAQEDNNEVEKVFNSINVRRPAEQAKMSAATRDHLNDHDFPSNDEAFKKAVEILQTSQDIKETRSVLLGLSGLGRRFKRVRDREIFHANIPSKEEKDVISQDTIDLLHRRNQENKNLKETTFYRDKKQQEDAEKDILILYKSGKLKNEVFDPSTGRARYSPSTGLARYDVSISRSGVLEKHRFVVCERLIGCKTQNKTYEYSEVVTLYPECGPGVWGFNLDLMRTASQMSGRTDISRLTIPDELLGIRECR